jgi:hypothetical protein
MPTQLADLDLYAYLARLAADFPHLGAVRLPQLQRPGGWAALLIASPAGDRLKEQLWALCQRGALPGVALSSAIEGATGVLTLTWPDLLRSEPMSDAICTTPDCPGDATHEHRACWYDTDTDSMWYQMTAADLKAFLAMRAANGGTRLDWVSPNALGDVVSYRRYQATLQRLRALVGVPWPQDGTLVLEQAILRLQQGAQTEG